MLTVKQYKALRVLRENPDITAMRFAVLYYTEPSQQYLFTAVSNCSNGAAAGVKAKLCAGSLLGKLKKQGLVSHSYIREKWVFSLTEKGKQALTWQKPQEQWGPVSSIEGSRRILREGQDVYSADMYYQKNMLPETGGWYLYRVPEYEKQRTLDEKDRFFYVFKLNMARGNIIPAWTKDALSKQKT